MSEQDSCADDFPRWLAGQGADAHALAWVGEDNDPLRWTARAPAVGRTAVDHPGADLSRLVLQGITHGQRETLRRWLELEGDSTDEPLAIIGTQNGSLREYTPGELVAQQLHPPGNGDVQLTQELAAGCTAGRRRHRRALTRTQPLDRPLRHLPAVRSRGRETAL